MHRIDRTEYGIRIDIDGSVTVTEMESFITDVKETLQSMEPGFGVVADLRGLQALSDEASEVLADAIAYTNQQEFGRAAVVVDSPILGLQQEQLGEDTDVSSRDRRVINTSNVDDWESQALDWVKHGHEPDQ